MLFHSQLFILAFLPIALAAFFTVRQPGARQWVTIALSMAFYAAADVRFLPLLAGSILVNWVLAHAILHVRGRRLALWIAIAANLAVLGWFKYRGFLFENWSALTGGIWEPSPLLLPIGISFFTFQQISYLVDLHAGRAPLHGFRVYAFYVSYFPQLVAGPIVRHNELIPQIGDDPLRPGASERVSRGLVLFVIGLVKKFAIADQLAPHADAVWNAAGSGAVTTIDAWTGTVAFALQIYFDFSGYSDMAIGLAAMMGIMLPYNFDAPYRATSVREFWRRWHMTLSRFLRDYVYIPLGGNRHGLTRQLAALMTTMGLCGLWHGAGWPFVVWGLWHGIGLAAVTLWARTGLRVPEFLGWAMTLVFVLLGWVFFRSETFAIAGTMFTAMAGQAAPGAATVGDFDVLLTLAATAVVFLLPTSQHVAFKALVPQRALAALASVALVAILLEVGKGQPASFIYFAF